MLMIKNRHLYILLIFSFLLFASCGRVEKNYYPNGGLESEIPYKQGQLHGTAVWYYPHGKKSLEITYKNGRKEGEMKRFFRNGTIETIENYKNDSLDGISLKYGENGVLLSEISYKNGKKDGIFKQYFSDGSLFITGKYTDDQYDGKWEYFDQEGFTVGEGNFIKGVGVLVGYDNSGNITKKVHYQNSILSKEEMYSKENHQIEKTIIYENGRIINIINN